MTTLSDADLLRLAEELQFHGRHGAESQQDCAYRKNVEREQAREGLIRLLSEKAELEREVEDLKSSVIAFAGPRAAQYAQEYGLPDRHLYAPHYDLLERCGARMDSFTRNPPRAALNKDPDQ